MMRASSTNYRYQLEQGWGKLPASWSWGVVSGVACDSQNRVYAFTRGEHPLMIFDPEGNFLSSWGEGIVQLAHGLYIDRADHVYCVDCNAHCIYQLDRHGTFVKTLGTPGKPGDHGKPFNRPTDIAAAPSGELFVSDGYVNRRVHKFSPDGKHLLSWGTQGDQPGQFALPHSVRVDSFWPRYG